MLNVLDRPLILFVVCLLVFWIAARIGTWAHVKRHDLADESREDFAFLVGGTLTLLGLIIGFTFSMAVSRYDQRKNYEEQEANAIGTEYLRADLLPAANATAVRTLLSSYLDQRILWYRSRDQAEASRISEKTARLQAELWTAVSHPGAEQPSPVAALAIAGMNDVLNSQGYTQAIWWDRIPLSAWMLLISIAIFCNLLIGYGARGRSPYILLILPIVLSVAIFLIAEIDTPRGGLIRVAPQNLEGAAQSLARR